MLKTIKILIALLPVAVITGANAGGMRVTGDAARTGESRVRMEKGAMGGSRPGRSIAAARPGKGIDTIRIDGNGTGRIFEGIGAVSAGGPSRQLIDYPEPYRSDILDYLFKPKFGAGFTYLKTEIGGDGNSTCGSEPSFARTRAEMSAPNYNRGYEYWLMREAANRNPAIRLDALEWTMPGWFNGVWSQDNADYLVKFIQGAQQMGLHMQYIGGCWNEREYNRNWIVDTLRPALDRSGLGHIKINAPEGAGEGWGICKELGRDSAFRKAVDVVSYHYPDSYMYSPVTGQAGPEAWNCGVTLWSGEDFSLAGKPWRNCMYLAKNILRVYIKQKLVAVNMWCPIASMPENTCFSNVGIMKATSPWSGHYEVWPAIWAVGHFTQFAQPGWQYIDNGCGVLPGDGIYGTYKSPDGKGDYSIVIVNGSVKQRVNFQVKGLRDAVLHVWRSNDKSRFVQQQDIRPIHGVVSLDLDAESIYSITTTTGQVKGVHAIPAPTVFASDYSDNFDRYSLKRAPLSPRYFYDNSGAFELYKAPGESQYLRQMVNKDITHWIPDECAYTFVTQGREWEDGEISSDVSVEEDAFNGTGYAGLILRGSYDKAGQGMIPYGYRLTIDRNHIWRLQTKTAVLDSGRMVTEGRSRGDDAAGNWHRLRLVCKGRSVIGYIDGKEVTNVTDDHYLLGDAGYVSGWNTAGFDNLHCQYTGIPGKLLSEWKPVTCSFEKAGSAADLVVDGNSYSSWRPEAAGVPQWMTVDLGQVCHISRSETFLEYAGRPHTYKLEYSTDGQQWSMYADRSNSKETKAPCDIDQRAVMGRYMRITLLPGADKGVPGLYELKIYGEMGQ